MCMPLLIKGLCALCVVLDVHWNSCVWAACALILIHRDQDSFLCFHCLKLQRGGKGKGKEADKKVGGSKAAGNNKKPEKEKEKEEEPR